MDRIQRYAPDTNFFLQAKTAEQLPWQDLTDAVRVELFLLDEVMGELDRHKANGNTRPARRARDVFAKLDPLIDDELEELVVKESGPQVVWRLAPFLDSGRTKPTVLDLSTADGRIVEQAVALQQMLGDLAFLSNDRLPRRMAKAVGLSHQKIPDSWLLDPETDDRDKEIAKLKDELRTWSKRSPQLEVQLVSKGEVIERVEGSICRYRPLSEEFLDDAMQVIEQRHPEESAGVPGQVTVTRAAAIEKYQQERSEWWNKTKEHLKRQTARLNLYHGSVDLTLAVSNSGSAPAEGLSVRAWVEGSMMLVNDVLKNELYTSSPRLVLPRPPKMERFSMLRQPTFPEHLSRMHDLIRMPPEARDLQGFYWDYKDKDHLMCKAAEGTCEDFRHQIRRVELPVILCLPQNEDEPRGCLHVRWSARNLPKAIEKKYPIRLAINWQDSDEVVGRLLIDSTL
ncbi:PIN domain-containing protein [Xanthomonas sacchari]